MINIVNAVKRYGGTLALNDIDLQIKDAGIYCLLGRNGAGKTTLLKSMAGHINLTAGKIFVEGKKVDTFNMPESLSFIEAQGKQFNMRVKEIIKYSAALSDVFDTEFALKTAEKFKLDLNKKYSKLSFGMKTMVSTLLSLASSSAVVILDEPVLGLDAIMRDRFYTLLAQSLYVRPRIIIVSTHLIDEISKVAENIIIIDKGKVLDNFAVAELDEKGYSITGMTSEVERAIRGLRVISRKTMGGFTMANIFDKRIAPPDNCTIQGMGLQDYFIGLVGGDEIADDELVGDKIIGGKLAGGGKNE